jgi:hypothetical protein
MTNIEMALAILAVVVGGIAGFGWGMYNTERIRYRELNRRISNPVNNQINQPNHIKNIDKDDNKDDKPTI